MKECERDEIREGKGGVGRGDEEEREGENSDIGV